MAAMKDTEKTGLADVVISSWAAPTESDLVVLDALSDAQFRALLESELLKGLESGISEKSMTDLWREAKSRTKASNSAL